MDAKRLKHPNYAQRLMRKFGIEPELCIDEGCPQHGTVHVEAPGKNPNRCVKAGCEHYGNAHCCAGSRERRECTPTYAGEPGVISFAVGDKAQKVGGSYQADGTIVAAFKTTTGDVRYVFEFAQPGGMLHIFGPSQLKAGHAGDDA